MGGNFSFDPNAVFPLKGYGTVYIGCKFTGEWGTIQVDGPALVSPDYQNAWIAAGPSTSASGKDKFKLTMNKGWKMVAGKRPGDFDIVKSH